MKRLIIDGNAVYEIDEQCMQKKQKENDRLEKNKSEETAGKKRKDSKNSSST